MGGHGFRIRLYIRAQLLGQHNGQSLVAGDHDGDDGSYQNAAKGQYFFAETG